MKRFEDKSVLVLGGSRARGTHRPDSDHDIGIYYRGDVDLAGLQALADEVLNRSLYGDQHPYGRYFPTEEMLKALEEGRTARQESPERQQRRERGQQQMGVVQDMVKRQGEMLDRQP